MLIVLAMRILYFSVMSSISCQVVLITAVLMLVLSVKVRFLIHLPNAMKIYSVCSMLIPDAAMFDDCEDGDVRLVGSVREYEGRVEVCINNAWGNICHHSWDASDGNVVCGQLGFQKFGKFYITSFQSTKL